MFNLFQVVSEWLQGRTKCETSKDGQCVLSVLGSHPTINKIICRINSRDFRSRHKNLRKGKRMRLRHETRHRPKYCEPRSVVITNLCFEYKMENSNFIKNMRWKTFWLLCGDACTQTSDNEDDVKLMFYRVGESINSAWYTLCCLWWKTWS